MPIISGSSSGSSSGAGTEIGYDQITASVNVVSTTEATPTTVISCAAHTFDGTAVLLTVFTPFLHTPSTAGGSITVLLFEGASEVARLGLGVQGTTTAGNDIYMPTTMQLRFTPTAASHTYTIAAVVTSTSGTPQVGAGTGSGAAYPPAFARFTKA